MSEVPINLSPEQRQILKTTRAWVLPHYDAALAQGRLVMGGHWDDHSQRVVSYALILAGLEKQEQFLPVLSGLLHDLGRTGDDPRAKNYKHGELSREMSEDFIKNLGLSGQERQLVLEAIEDHPLLNENVRKTWLVSLLQDADRLDALAPQGLLRMGAGRWKLPVSSSKKNTGGTAENQLLTISDDVTRVLEWNEMLWTDSAKILARPMVDSLSRYKSELDLELSGVHESFDSIGI